MAISPQIPSTSFIMLNNTIEHIFIESSLIGGLGSVQGGNFQILRTFKWGNVSTEGLIDLEEVTNLIGFEPLKKAWYQLGKRTKASQAAKVI